MRLSLTKEIVRNATAYKFAWAAFVGAVKTPCIIVVIGLLAGCAAPQMNTPSGRPEVTIKATRIQVKTALAAMLVDKRWDIVTETDLTLVAEHETNAAADFFFTNSLTGERPRNRVRFTIIETSGQTRLIAIPYFSHAPGLSGRTAESEMTNVQPYRDLQWFLDCLAADLEGRSRPPEPPKPKVTPASAPKGQ